MLTIPWLDEAKKYIGLQEWKNGSNPKIEKFAQVVGGDVALEYTDDNIPWCGLYVAYVFAQVGINPVKRPLWARNWANFGEKLKEPAYGCVVTFSRNSGGHVGFYLGEEGAYYIILGGNQSDSVSITKIEKSRAISYNWPLGDEFKKFFKPGRVKTKMANIKISKNEA